MKTLFTYLLITSIWMLTEQFAPKAETPANPNNDPQITGTIMILQARITIQTTTRHLCLIPTVTTSRQFAMWPNDSKPVEIRIPVA